MIGSRGISIGVLLGWQLAISPILLATGKLDVALPGAALERLEPAAGDARISLFTAAAVLAVWTAVALTAGAWRTLNREA